MARRKYNDVVEVTVLAYGCGVKGEEVVVDDESEAMMSGGDVDVEPFLISQNTLGNGNRKLKISNVKCQMVVAELMR